MRTTWRKLKARGAAKRVTWHKISSQQWACASNWMHLMMRLQLVVAQG